MFTINNETWYLKFVPSSHFQLSKTNGDKSLGVCDDTSKTIYLDERLQGALLKKVICHEVTHAAMFSYDINLSLEQEEILADLIATYGEEILTITNKIFTKLKRG